MTASVSDHAGVRGMAIRAAGLTALLTLYWQHRIEQRDAKLKVFSSLMSVRGNILNFQPAQEWVRSLQLIDVVFADVPDVLKHWRELYLMLPQQEAPSGPGPQDDCFDEGSRMIWLVFTATVAAAWTTHPKAPATS
jgi:hypothetical protein